MRTELNNIHKEMAELLEIKEPTLLRKRRIAASALAFGAVSAIGGGMAIGTSLACTLKGIFGTCTNWGKKNNQAIKSLIRRTDFLGNELISLQNGTNEKFFLVALELRELEEARRQMESTQKLRWETTQKQLRVLEKNMNLGRSCDQFLNTKEQAEHYFAGVMASLQTIHAEVETFRTALFSYKSNILLSLGDMMNGIMPLNLIPKNHLREILQEVVLKNANGGSRLTLAIPLHSLLTYYETPLIEEITTIETGLLLNVMIPLSSGVTSFTVYKATAVPMPKANESPNALIYKLETPYVAVSEVASSHTAPITEDDLETCVGSRSYAICLNHFAISSNPTSCIASLKLGNENKALATCKVQSVALTYPEQATNIGEGKWLITAVNPRFKMRLFENNEETDVLKGCQVCIIKIPCGGKLKTNHLTIQADSSSCANRTITKIEVKMADPLQYLISALQPIENIPHQPTIEAAEASLIEEVQ